jgi:hypothetical protein
MKLIINIVLVLLIVLMGYLLVSSIQEPIEFEEVKDRREARVVDRLMDVRASQEIYRAITGEFAGDFDTLIQVLKTDSIPNLKIIGDPDDVDGTFEIDTFYYSAIDSIKGLGIELDSLPFIPYGGDKEFYIKADTLNYQKTLVYVVEVGATKKDFMGKFGDERYAKYDKSYNPNDMLKFGDLNKPTLTGNWE